MNPSTPDQPNDPNPRPRRKDSKSAAGLSPALERLLPQDEKAERALLGAMIQSREAINDVVPILADLGSVFSRESHQWLYNALADLYNANRLSDDGLVLADELKRRGVWDKLGGWKFLQALLDDVPSYLRARQYAEIVRDKALLRHLINALHKVMNVAFEARRPAKEILDQAEHEIFAVTERRASGEAQPIADLVREAFKTIERRDADALSGEPTGYPELDDLTSGLQRGDLVIVAGRPSMGKTAFGLNLAENMAIHYKRPVLFFSLEMSRQQIAQRILCSRARVDAHRLRRGRHSQADLERLTATGHELSEAPLLVDDSSDLTILETRARARMAFRRHQIAAIFVDYLQLMRVPGTESRQVEVATISRGLKALAKDLNVPVIAMAQLNRGPEDQKQRKGNRPRMSDLRESGAIEQDADVIMLLHREAYYRSGEDAGGEGDGDGEDNLAEVIVAKQRNGPTGTIKLHFNRQYTRFDTPMPTGAPLTYIPRDPDVAPF
ncbi:MAG: replicative DNA helicase [Phycisphaerales bacterium]|nr:replicative DNA helicase [Phycisphaerales bacterium]